MSNEEIAEILDSIECPDDCKIFCPAQDYCAKKLGDSPFMDLSCEEMIEEWSERNGKRD